MKTLVWITNSFREDSRLTHNLEGECTFVYYSPYYFAGERERNIYKKCSQKNLEIFYFSINQFDRILQNKGGNLYIFKEEDPINHILFLCEKYGFERLIIDQPLFALWHSIDLLKLSIPFEIVDSSLIDDKCLKMTAKSRWMNHVKSDIFFHEWNSNIKFFPINEISESYPEVECPTPFVNRDLVLDRAFQIAPTYGQTRDHHSGQTQLSTLLHNGMIDPHNIFYEIVEIFKLHGADLSSNEGLHASMLRQFAFREINIITARKSNLTLENTPLEWARSLMHHKAFDNLLSSEPRKDSTLTLEKIKTAQTGIYVLDYILEPFVQSGIMPNRARMYFGGKIFYESKTGIEALELLIDTFDMIGLDGQSPNNYIQCVSVLGLSYGKVMLMSPKRTFDLLQYSH